jgi:hypothetical protein
MNKLRLHISECEGLTVDVDNPSWTLHSPRPSIMLSAPKIPVCGSGVSYSRFLQPGFSNRSKGTKQSSQSTHFIEGIGGFLLFGLQLQLQFWGMSYVDSLVVVGSR